MSLYADNNKSKSVGNIKAESIIDGPYGTAGWVDLPISAFTNTNDDSTLGPTSTAIIRYQVKGKSMFIFWTIVTTGVGLNGTGSYAIDLPATLPTGLTTDVVVGHFTLLAQIGDGTGPVLYQASGHRLLFKPMVVEGAAGNADFEVGGWDAISNLGGTGGASIDFSGSATIPLA